MSAGSIVIDLLAKTSSFDTDIQRSTKAAEKRMREMKATAEQWGSAVSAAFVGAATAGVFASKQMIDGIDALNDVADATGSTVEKISALEDIAVRTGTSMDTVSSALVKFNQSLGNADGKDGVSQALKAIGLEAAELKRMDPADALLKTAVALSKFADDGDKARLVQELFGKSVAEVAPLLKDLADKGELVATVTSEQARQAEAFNQQLSGLKKNATDLGRSILSDLLPPLNAFLNAMRESGGLVGFLTTGGKQTDNPGAALNDINAKLEKMKKLRDDLDPSKSFANSLNDKVFGDVGDLDKQIGLLEKQRAYLKSLQSFEALRGQGDVGDAQSRRLADRPSVGPLPGKPGAKGKDPDADFKAYLNNLQQQIQKTNELTVSEKLLDDIRRGSLTVSPKQKEQLIGVANEVDATKEAIRVSAERQAQRTKDNEDALRALNDISQAERDRLRTLLDAGPVAQAEKFRKEMELLDRQLAAGNITAEKYRDAINGLPALNSGIEETKSLTEQLGLTFTSSFESAIFGGGKLSEVFRGLLMDIAKVIFRLQVVEPLMKQLQGGGGVPANPYAAGSGGGIDWGGIIGSFFGGMRAGGGPVEAGKAYVVGERRAELFVPRTSGAILPSVPAGAGGGENITIVNQTQGRVDKVVEQRPSPRERVLFIQEVRDAVAADLSNPNSGVSRSLGRNFKVQRNR